MMWSEAEKIGLRFFLAAYSVKCGFAEMSSIDYNRVRT